MKFKDIKWGGFYQLENHVKPYLCYLKSEKNTSSLVGTCGTVTQRKVHFLNEAGDYKSYELELTRQGVESYVELPIKEIA